MDSFTQWTIIISSVAIVSGVLVSVVPSGKMKKAYKMLTVSVLIYGAIFPLSDLDAQSIDFQKIFQDGSVSQQELEENAQSTIVISAQKALSSLIAQTLAENEIEVSAVEAECELKEEKLIVKSFILKGNLSESQQRKATDLILDTIENSKGIKIIFQGERDE